MELQRSLPDFTREDIALFALSYDPVAVLRSFAETHGITYPLLSDEGSHVIRTLGLLNAEVPEGERAYGVPYPGSFLLDERGVVTEKRFEQSYRERETGAGVLEQGFGGRSSVHGPEATGGSEGVHVRAFLDSATYAFFQRLWLTVELTVEDGLHIYGRPIPEGFIPLTVELEAVNGLVVGESCFPEPHPFRVQGLDEQFSVYEGTVHVSVPVTFTARDAGDQTLPVAVHYQACSATDCLLPAAVRLELLARVQALAPQ